MLGENDVTMTDRALTIISAAGIGVVVLAGCGLFVCLFGLAIAAIQ